MDNNKSGIYKIANLMNGHFYIGSAVNLKRRWKEHRVLLRRGSHHCEPLQRAWNKYGENSFIFAILRVVENPKELIANEQRFIDDLRPHYNTCPTAGSRLGFKHTEETKRKISIAHFGMTYSDEARQNMSKSHIGKSPSNKGVAHSKESKEKNRKAHPGKIDSEETKRKKSVSIKNWWEGRKRVNE